jgi:hypothetical protein
VCFYVFVREIGVCSTTQGVAVTLLKCRPNIGTQCSMHAFVYLSSHLISYPLSLTLSSFSGAMSLPFLNTPKHNYITNLFLHSTCAFLPPSSLFLPPSFYTIISHIPIKTDQITIILK